MKTNVSSLKFKFDVSAYRLLGRELITDRITALFELVKNSYDANAENVTIEFIDVNPLTEKSKIIIRDDGIGMAYEDIRDKWMVIGTSSKRKNTESPAPYHRKVAGKKGVGRFAVDKLGAKLLLRTKKENSSKATILETDWTFYFKEENRQLQLNFDGEQKLFTDIENNVWFEDVPDNSHGTTLEITHIADVWSENDISRAYKELAKIIRPKFIQKYPFNVYIKAPYEKYKETRIESLAIEHATLTIELGFNAKQDKQEILAVENGELKKILVPKRACGLVNITLYYYDQKAKAKFNKSTDERVDGIKVYRDGLIATPFAEYNANRDEQKDLFGIDKRRWSGFFDKVGTRDLLGWIDISENRNPMIIDATNRQDFVDNDAWRELKSLVIEQIKKIEEALKKKKTIERIESKTEFGNANLELKTVREKIKQLEQVTALDDPIKIRLDEVSKDILKIQATVNKSFSDYRKLEEEKKRQEDLLFSLVSLQTYASMLSHITRTAVGRIKRQVEFITKWLPTGTKNDSCEKYSRYVFSEMKNLDRAVDFMLKYAKDDQDFENINVKDTLENIFNNIYQTEFDKHGVKVMFEINKELTIRYNQKAFEDMFDNLISNSLKAFKDIKERIIKCSCVVEKDNLIIYFSDNGCGIADSDRHRIFDVFYTTTSEEGGAGLGLFIVKSRLEAIHGSIELIENELKPSGTTFKILFPFKKD
ncbi:sensor histidine kinase [Bacteroides sp. 51]|uniref:sensor histidine kinase n=1 Tax=Bacteroides sp. 51 TaxID=2302938 RepID=UPI0013D4B3D8|nr:sensor histidine kinase [Bacteroides sp. 51]NDV82541.1 GHKL domain-containing protein [Bacteroides sp. 51]